MAWVLMMYLMLGRFLNGTGSGKCVRKEKRLRSGPNAEAPGTVCVREPAIAFNVIRKAGVSGASQRRTVRLHCWFTFARTNQDRHVHPLWPEGGSASSRDVWRCWRLGNNLHDQGPATQARLPVLMRRMRERRFRLSMDEPILSEDEIENVGYVQPCAANRCGEVQWRIKKVAGRTPAQVTLAARSSH